MKDVLANSVGVLYLASEDGSDDISVTASSNTEDPKRKCNDTSTSKKKGKEEELKPSSAGAGEYKLPPVWIDLEMTGDGFDDDWYEDSTSHNLDVSELNHEHGRRHDYFHTIGYRDGLMAAKEASAQEGFNIGFKQSAIVGYECGHVRGVTSALSSLPESLKDKLPNSMDLKSHLDKFQRPTMD